ACKNGPTLAATPAAAAVLTSSRREGPRVSRMFMGFLRLDRCYVEWAEPRWRRGQRLRRALEVLSVDWERSARDEMSPRTLRVRARVSKDERQSPGNAPADSRPAYEAAALLWHGKSLWCRHCFASQIAAAECSDEQ